MIEIGSRVTHKLSVMTPRPVGSVIGRHGIHLIVRWDPPYDEIGSSFHSPQHLQLHMEPFATLDEVLAWLGAEGE